VTLRSKS